MEITSSGQKRAYEEIAPIEEVQQICQRIQNGTFSLADINALYEIANKDGVQVDEDVDLEDICLLLMHRFGITPPARDVQFSDLPPEVQEMVWQQYFDPDPSREDIQRQMRTFGTLSKGQRPVQRSALRSLQQTALTFPVTTPFSWGQRDTITSCQDLGFNQSNCLTKTLLPVIPIGPKTTFDEIIPLLNQEELDALNTIVWNCPCIAIEFPFTSHTVDLFTIRYYFTNKGHFTLEDLLRIVSDYLQGYFTEEEIESIIERTEESRDFAYPIVSFTSTPRPSLEEFFRQNMMEGIIELDDLRSRKVKRNALFNEAFVYFSAQTTAGYNEVYLLTHWADPRIQSDEPYSIEMEMEETL